jgi:hypothetical protein
MESKVDAWRGRNPLLKPRVGLGIALSYDIKDALTLSTFKSEWVYEYSVVL